MNFEISLKDKFDSKNLCIVLNCGNDIKLNDDTYLKSFSSGLFKNTKFEGEQLVILELNSTLEVSPDIAKYCRDNWTPVYDIFAIDEFKGADFFRSPKVKLNNLEFNFWYCGANFSCGIHNKHDFFELHTQILGQGEMQKFTSNNEESLYYREILNPGQTHSPFYNEQCEYPYHRYKSITPCIWLAIESQTAFPVRL